MTISLVHETLAFTHAHNNLQVVTPLMVIEFTIDVQAFYTHTYILPVCNHRASFSMAYVSVCIRILHLYTFILYTFLLKISKSLISIKENKDEIS